MNAYHIETTIFLPTSDPDASAIARIQLYIDAESTREAIAQANTLFSSAELRAGFTNWHIYKSED